MEKKIPFDLTVPIIYYKNDDGEIVYDYEEMASHFSFALSQLNNEIIEAEIFNYGPKDDIEEAEG